MMLIKISILLFWIAYSVAEGKREAWYFHLKSAENFFQARLNTINEHGLFLIQRILVGMVCVMAISPVDVDRELWNKEDIERIVYLFSLALIFPFIHDGVYYYFRNRYNPMIYPKRFFDQSETSTAVMTQYFTPINRAIAFIVGVVAYFWI